MTDITPHQPDNRKNGENDPEAYKVGYRKPPLHSRFRPHQSGNPGGRRKRKKTETYGESIESILRELIPGFENGKAISITRCKALARTIVDRGIGGDPAYEDFLLMVERPDLSRRSARLHWVELDSEDEIPPQPPETQDRPAVLFPEHRRANGRRYSHARYGYPPTAQIQPDPARIPRGRPRNDATLIELIKRELNKRIKVEENGKTRTMTKREAWMRRLINSAQNGNARALKTFVKVFRPTEPPPEDSDFYLIGGK
jgi:hypothetical protein